MDDVYKAFQMSQYQDVLVSYGKDLYFRIWNMTNCKSVTKPYITIINGEVSSSNDAADFKTFDIHSST